MKLKDLKDNIIVKNLVLAVAFCILLIVGAAVTLRLVTKHGKTVIAPDFTGVEPLVS